METKDQITEFKSFFESHVDVERKSIETAIKEREAFLSEYPLSRLKELSIDEYCIGTEQSKNSLCYLIEFGKYKHTGFGIGGGSSKKYGVYYNKTEQCYKHGILLYWKTIPYFRAWRWFSQSFCVCISPRNIFL